MALVIPLEVQGNGEFTSAFQGMRAAVRDFRDEVARLRQALGRPLPKASLQSPAAQQVNQVGQAAAQARGPVAALHRAYQQLHRAQQTGDPGQMFDAQYAVHSATRRYNRAASSMRPKTFWDMAKDAFMTSRVGFGGGAGGVMPLVNRLVPMLAKLGPVGMGIAAAVAALVAIPVAISKLIDVTDKLTQQQRALVNARYTAGASYGQLYQMQVLGGAVGTDAQGVAQAARQFAEAIGQGGWAAGQWRQFGVADVNGPYGKVNKMDNLLRAVDVLLKLPERDAIRLARESGLEQFLPLRDASPEKVRSFMETQRNLVTPESARAAADFQIELARLKAELQALIPYATPLVKFVADLAASIRGALEVLAPFMGAWFQFQMGIVNIVAMVSALSRGDVRGAVDAAKRAKESFVGSVDSTREGGRRVRDAMTGNRARRDAADAARDRNTEAINENTRELRRVREIIGGGDRARKAVPSSWRYEMLNRQLDTLATQLGGL